MYIDKHDDFSSTRNSNKRNFNNNNLYVSGWEINRHISLQNY